MSNLFGINLLVAFGSCALLGGFTLSNLAAGFLVGFATLGLVGPIFGHPNYFGRAVRVVRLFVYFLWELTISGLQVARDVLSPVQKASPAIVAIPLDLTDPGQIAALANLISLTPGSLSLDVSPDQKTLYVHGMFVEDPDEFRRHIKNGFERRIREAME